jgi:hypothetical protein
VLGLDGEAAAGFGQACFDAHAAGDGDAIGERAAQLGERSHAALVAPPPCRDALVQPHGFGSELLLELRLLARLGFQHLLGPILEGAVTAIEAAQQAAIEPQHPVRQSAQECPVVADGEQRAAKGLELLLEPFDGRQIEMVGRLVEQQQRRARYQGARQVGAARLAAREFGRRLVAGEIEPRQHVGDARRRLGPGFDPEPAAHIIGDACAGAEARFLRQIGDARTRLHEARARIELDLAGQHAQQGRFAGAVATDQAGALVRRQCQIDAGKKRPPAEGDGGAGQLHQRGARHVAKSCS